MKLFSNRVALGAVLLLAAGSMGLAQIQRLTLSDMVQQTDGAIVGTIAASKVFRVDHPIDGPELYFTTLTISGRSLVDQSELAVDVTFPGGFITPDEGVWNSEAPSAEETRLGNRVVAFYKWLDNMGGDVAGNALYASHGGLYQVVQGRGAQVVLGKGDGYAVSANVALEALDSEIAKLAQAKK
jgi:hypothetical protein